MKLFGSKTVDDVLSVFTKAVDELNAIAAEKHDEAIAKREEAEQATQGANAAEGEAGRARLVIVKIKDLIKAE